MPKDNAINEITIRKYEKPYSTDKRQLVKKICLSLGLLQPGDGRDVIVDILLVLVEEQKKKNLVRALDALDTRWGDFTVFPARMLDMEHKVQDRIAFGGVRSLTRSTIYHDG